jgi:hypothetical protein
MPACKCCRCYRAIAKDMAVIIAGLAIDITCGRSCRTLRKQQHHLSNGMRIIKTLASRSMLLRKRMVQDCDSY